MTYVLEIHAAQALGVRVDQVNLPRSQYGVDGDALWVDPRFIEVRRQREVIARQMAEHRVDVELHKCSPPRIPEEVKMMKRRERKRARNARRKAMRAAAPSI